MSLTLRSNEAITIITSFKKNRLFCLKHTVNKINYFYMFCGQKLNWRCYLITTSVTLR